ncbi:MAG: hypothetical protein HONDAALG_02555 [Gammaproteobacteria bacterium]|nr:hypothetical protein [Gammaproteobacteria bacterium]
MIENMKTRNPSEKTQKQNVYYVAKFRIYAVFPQDLEQTKNLGLLFI